MKTPTHTDIAKRAREIWLIKGLPIGQDTDIWYEAERLVTAEANAPEAASTPRPIPSPPPARPQATAHGAGSTPSEPSATHAHITMPGAAAQAVDAGLQRVMARAPRRPAKPAPTAASPQTGKPLWSHPHSS